MKLEPMNVVCPKCGNGNYMRHLVGKNVGEIDIKCLNCNSYFRSKDFYEKYSKKHEMTEHEKGEWDMFVTISSAFHGKQYYFIQEDGRVYSRESGKDMSVQDAYNEFLDRVGLY